METVDVELPAGWTRLEAAGCSYLACHTGRTGGMDPVPDGAGTDDVHRMMGDARPITVKGLDILSRTDSQAAGDLHGLGSVSSIIAMVYPTRDVLSGFEGLYVIDEGSTEIAGIAAQRMDLTYRRAGLALFTRRWIMTAGGQTLEVAATCPLDHFRRHIRDFDELEQRIHVAA